MKKLTAILTAFIIGISMSSYCTPTEDDLHYDLGQNLVEFVQGEDAPDEKPADAPDYTTTNTTTTTSTTTTTTTTTKKPTPIRTSATTTLTTTTRKTASRCTSTTTTEPPSDVTADMIGDANCDTEVNLADSVFIMQCITNPDKYQFTAKGEKNADTDGSSDATNKDAHKILHEL